MKNGWSTGKLGDVCETIQDGAHESPQKQFDAPAEGRFLYITSKNIRTNYVDLDNVSYVERDFHDRIYPRCQPRVGDVLLTKDGANTGNVTLNTIDEPFSLLSSVCLIKTNPAALKPAFLCYYLQSPDGLKGVTGQMTGAAIKRIILRDIKLATIPLPPLSEQQRIVGILDEAFEGLATATANAKKNLRNARALFESHLQSVFTQRGPGWVETTLNRATDGIFTGPFGSLLHKNDYVANGIPLVNPAHITEVGIEPDLRKTVSKATALRLKNYIMREGDIVIGRRGEMGRCALVTEVEDGWLCGTGSFFIKPSSRCDARYLVRFLRSDGCKARLEKIAGGAVMPNLSNTDLGNLVLDLPPFDRQITIVEEIDSLHEEAQRLARLYERKLAALDALKKSLLHQAFSGQLTMDHGQRAMRKSVS